MQIRSLVGLAAGLALTATGIGLTAGHAQAAVWQQPYGGCEEATLAPHSAGAWECRDHGWTITRQLAVNPRGVVMGSGLPHCREEDGSGQREACSWNFRDGHRDGNGEGAALWYDRHDRVHYVWAHNPKSDGWHWSRAVQSQALGRTDCLVKDGTHVNTGLIARCPG